MRPTQIWCFDADGRLCPSTSRLVAEKAVAKGRALWAADNAIQLTHKRIQQEVAGSEVTEPIILYRHSDGRPLLTGKYAADSLQEIHEAMAQAAASKEPRHIPGAYVHEEMASELAPYPNESAGTPLSSQQRTREADFRWGACSRREDRRAGGIDDYRLSRPARQRARRRVFRAAVGCHKPNSFKCSECGRYAECVARYQQSAAIEAEVTGYIKERHKRHAQVR